MVYKARNGSALKEIWDVMIAGTMATTKHDGILHTLTLQESVRDA
jgi:hypothetical protein